MFYLESIGLGAVLRCRLLYFIVHDDDGLGWMRGKYLSSEALSTVCGRNQLKRLKLVDFILLQCGRPDSILPPTNSSLNHHDAPPSWLITIGKVA